MEEHRLEVNPYDRVSSMLIALLVSSGLVAALLVAVWLSNKVSTPATSPSEVILRKDGRGGGDGRSPGGTQLDIPSENPFSGTGKDTVDTREKLDPVGAAVTATDLEVVDFVSTEDFNPPGSRGKGDGMYGPDGPGRGKGCGPGEPGERKPPPQGDVQRHWEVVFQKGNTLDHYARQLDFFKIELGVPISNPDRIEYAYNFTKSKPDKKTVLDPSATEHRYYLTWRSGDLEQADRELLQRASIDSENRPVLKFLPPETEQQLVALERDYRGASPKDIAKTRFGVRSLGDGFEIFVLEQTLKR
jgi:hypothetical protein